jgi:hypothetical protein
MAGLLDAPRQLFVASGLLGMVAPLVATQARPGCGAGRRTGGYGELSGRSERGDINAAVVDDPGDGAAF